MKLITETYMSGIESLVENSNSGKKFKIEGPFAIAEAVNRNRRKYPAPVMESAMNRYISEKVSLGRGYGELNHPQSPQVNFERVVMVIEGLRREGNQWIGKGNIINEGLGKIVTAIMENGGKVGVSTRGLGTVSQDSSGIAVVNNDLVFSAIDVVSDPSGPGCFVNGIMESVNYRMLEDGTIIELAVDVSKKKINEQKALKAFAHLMLKYGDNK